MIGISYQNLRRVMVEVLGEKPVLALETGFALVKTLVTEGPMAAWEQLKDMAAEMRDAFVGAVKDFIKWKIVEEAIKWVVSLFIPGAGIVKAIIGIYDTVVFFIQKAKQIAQMVANFLGSIGEIAAGNIGAAAEAMENGLARGLSLVISFLAALLRLNGITAKIRDAIQKVRSKVDAALLKVVKWIAEKAKGLLQKLASQALGGDTTLPPMQRLQNGVREGTQAVNRLSGNRIGIAVIRPVLAVIRLRHNLVRLDGEPRAGRWAVVGVVNPTLAELSTKLVDTTTAGAEQRTYNAVNSRRFATAATVTRLSSIGSPQPPTAEGNPAWDVLRRRMLTAGGEYYVRGHLINGTFGGPGNDWRNLTALTQRANNSSIASMLRTFENPVRDEVKNGGEVTLRVEAVYRPLGRAAVAADLRAGRTIIPSRTPAQMAVIADVVEAEDAVPAEVVATGSVQRGGSSTVLPESRTQNVIDTDLTRYFVGAAAGAVIAPATRPEINVSIASVAVLKTLVGVDAAKAALIIAARPPGGFADRDDFVMRMGSLGPALLHSMVSTAHVRVVYR